MSKKNYLKNIFTVFIVFLVQLLSNSCKSIESNNDVIDVVISGWTIYSKENSGLPDNEISALEIDNNNHLWIGTLNNGIAKFDGSKWIQYNTNNSGLASNTIWCISVDHSNNVWIGTSNGLTEFDGKNWKVYNTSNSLLPASFVSALAVDVDNTLWIGCANFATGGVLSFNGFNWKIYTKENSLLPSGLINVIHIDKSNNKWVGTFGGIVKIDDQNNWKVFTKNNSGLLFGVNAITTDLNNNVWVGANELERLDFGHYYGGLQKFDGENWLDYRPHPKGVYNPKAIVSNRVDRMVCDRYGLLLIVTEAEWKFPYNLSFFKNGAWENLSDLAQGFPINLFVRDIKIDKNNTVWLATQIGVVNFHYSSQ